MRFKKATVYGFDQLIINKHVKIKKEKKMTLLV